MQVGVAEARRGAGGADAGDQSVPAAHLGQGTVPTAQVAEPFHSAALPPVDAVVVVGSGDGGGGGGGDGGDVGGGDVGGGVDGAAAASAASPSFVGSFSRPPIFCCSPATFAQ